MAITISEAEEADLPAMAALWNYAIRETTHTFTNEEKTLEGLGAWLADRRRAGEAVLVAKDEGAFVGFACYFPFRSGPGYRWTKEFSIYVDNAQQGSGLGRALLSALEEEAKARGVHSLWAGCSASNENAVSFHKHLGYQEVTRLPEVGWKFGKWLDLVLLAKHL